MKSFEFGPAPEGSSDIKENVEDTSENAEILEVDGKEIEETKEGRAKKLGKIAKIARNLVFAGGVLGWGLSMPVLNEARKEIDEYIVRAIQTWTEKLANPEGFTEHMPRRVEQLQEAFGSHYQLGGYGEQSDESEHEVRETSSIEGRDGAIGQEAFRKVLNTYPKTWVGSEVESITQKEEKFEDDDKYGLGKGWDTVAVCEGGYAESKSTITFYGPSREEYVADVVSHTLPHELAHANDWEKDREADLETRVNLLYQVNKRLSAEDRYRSYYVESITNDDKQQEAHLKAKEYWAEITAAYFSDPTELDVKDFRIVDKFVQLGDVDYDVYKTADERTRIVHAETTQDSDDI